MLRTAGGDRTRKRWELPGCAPNSRRRFQTRKCWELPGCAPNSRRCSPTESDSRKEKQTTKMKLEEPRKGEEPPSTPHCTAHHTLHTHPCTHTQFLFCLVPYRTLYHEGRHATHHTKSTSSHTPPSCFFEGRWGGPILYPSRLPASPHTTRNQPNSQSAKPALQQRKTQPAQTATSPPHNHAQPHPATSPRPQPAHPATGRTTQPQTHSPEPP